MSPLTLAGCAVVFALLGLVLRQTRPELALPVTAGGALLLMAAVMSPLAAVLDTLRETCERAGIPTEWLGVLCRALGVALLTQLAADCCRDAGETALASRAELAGRVGIAVLALPLLSQVVQAVTGLLAN